MSYVTFFVVYCDVNHWRITSCNNIVMTNNSHSPDARIHYQRLCRYLPLHGGRLRYNHRTRDPILDDRTRLFLLRLLYGRIRHSPCRDGHSCRQLGLKSPALRDPGAPTTWFSFLPPSPSLLLYALKIFRFRSDTNKDTFHLINKSYLAILSMCRIERFWIKCLDRIRPQGG